MENQNLTKKVVIRNKIFQTIHTTILDENGLEHLVTIPARNSVEWPKVELGVYVENLVRAKVVSIQDV